MGKTTLLSQYAEAARSAGFHTSWVNEEDEDVVAVLDRVANSIGPSTFKPLIKAIEQYRSLKHQLEGHPDAPEGLARVVASAAGRAGTKLGRRIPVAGAALDFVDEEAVGDQLGDVAAFVLQRSKHQSDARLVLDPVEVLSPMFVEGLREAMRTQPVALFFDTFEVTSHTLEPWLLQLLEGRFGDLPLSFQIAVAGRHAPDPNLWGPYEGLMERVELEPFSDEEAREFLSRHRVTDPDEVEELVRLSLGLPILLVSMTIGNPGERHASDTAVERVLRSVPEPMRKVAIAGAFPRTLNRDILEVVLPKGADPDEAFEWLVGMPFVQSTGDGWKYHDVIRQEFLKYAHRESPKQWGTNHTHLSNHYAAEIDERAPDGKIPQELFGALREHLYHNVCRGEADDLRMANGLCLATWNISPAAVRIWAVAIRDAEQDTASTSKRWGEAWIDAARDAERGRDQSSIELMTNLIDREALDESNRVLALTLRGDLYYRQSRMDASLEDLQRALELDPGNARTHYERAWIYLHLEEDEKALLDSEAAIRLGDREQAAFPNYRVMYVRAARKLFDPEDVLALIDDVLGFEETAWGFQIRGQLHRDLGHSEKAIEDFHQAMEMSSNRAHAGWESIGGSHLDDRRFPQASEAFRNALDVDWECPHCWRSLALSLQREGLGDGLAKALMEVCDGIEDGAVRGYRGVGMLSVGIAEEGVAELRQAIAEDPARPELRLWLARAMLSEGNTGEALREIEEALKLQPEWPAAIVARGLCYYRLGDYRGAVRDWDLAERISPPQVSIVSLCDRGLTHSILGDYDRAIEFLDRAIADDASPEAIYNRAVARTRLRGLDQAREELEAAMKVVAEAEDEVVRHYGEAGINALLGQTEGALRSLKTACSLDESPAKRWAVADPAWEHLREDPQFAAACG
jgi:tetratricopeptide (TPR) repeat protein